MSDKKKSTWEEKVREESQAEVIFLKNLLIEMLEVRDKPKEEKKEEWVDITDECKINLLENHISISSSNGWFLFKADLERCNERWIPFKFKMVADRILKKV